MAGNMHGLRCGHGSRVGNPHTHWTTLSHQAGRREQGGEGETDLNNEALTLTHGVTFILGRATTSTT
jgi:hypothetical protein